MLQERWAKLWMTLLTLLWTARFQARGPSDFFGDDDNVKLFELTLFVDCLSPAPAVDSFSL